MEHRHPHRLFDPGITSYDCCQIDEISPQFTVPANQETTVPLDLAVSSTPTGNFAAGGNRLLRRPCDRLS